MRRSLYILACFFCTLIPDTAFSQKEAAAKTADSLLNYAGNTYQQDLKSTLQATREALQLAREHQLEKHICKAYTQLGVMYTNAGLYTNALEEFHKALSIAKKKGWGELEADIITDLGNVYYYEDSLTRALDYYELSLEKSEKYQNLRLIARNLGNIGLVNQQLGNYGLAKKFTLQALQMSIKTGNKRGTCVNYENLATLYTFANKLDSAQHYYLMAQQIAQQSNFLWEQIYIYQGMAKVQRKLEDWNASKRLLLNALDLSQKSSSTQLIKSIFLELSEHEEQAGNYRKALEYQRKHNILRDSLSTLAQRKEQQHFYHLMEVERNVNENNILKANIAAQKHELKASMANQEKQLAITIAVGIALLMAVGIMFFILYHYHQNKKNHQQLQQMHQAIQTQAKELEDAYQKIQQYNLELEGSIGERTRQLNQQNKQLIQYAYFNAHKVRGPLARIMGLVNLLPKAAHPLESEFIQDRLAESAQELDKVIHEINLILEVKQPVNQDN